MRRAFSGPAAATSSESDMDDGETSIHAADAHDPAGWRSMTHIVDKLTALAKTAVIAGVWKVVSSRNRLRVAANKVKTVQRVAAMLQGSSSATSEPLSQRRQLNLALPRKKSRRRSRSPDKVSPAARRRSPGYANTESPGHRVRSRKTSSPTTSQTSEASSSSPRQMRVTRRQTAPEAHAGAGHRIRAPAASPSVHRSPGPNNQHETSAKVEGGERLVPHLEHPVALHPSGAETERFSRQRAALDGFRRGSDGTGGVAFALDEPKEGSQQNTSASGGTKARSSWQAEQAAGRAMRSQLGTEYPALVDPMKHVSQTSLLLLSTLKHPAVGSAPTPQNAGNNSGIPPGSVRGRMEAAGTGHGSRHKFMSPIRSKTLQDAGSDALQTARPRQQTTSLAPQGPPTTPVKSARYVQPYMAMKSTRRTMQLLKQIAAERQQLQRTKQGWRD